MKGDVKFEETGEGGMQQMERHLRGHRCRWEMDVGDRMAREWKLDVAIDAETVVEWVETE